MTQYGAKVLPFILIFLCFTLTTGMAQAELTVTITSSQTALVANGHDNTTIRVLVQDNGTPLSGTPVGVSVHNPLFGSFTEQNITTGPLGYGETLFQAGTHSGPAIITAVVENATPASVPVEVQAPVADSITLTTDREWVVANGTDSSHLSARITNTSRGVVFPIPNVAIPFYIAEGTTMGSVSPLYAYTGTDGTAFSTYISGTKSGQVTLLASAGSLQGSVIQKLDHDVPTVITSEHVVETTAGEVIPVSVLMKDRWGNVVDNRNAAELVTFIVGSEDGTAAFFDGSTWDDMVNLSVNATGQVSGSLRVSERPGFNNVQIIPPAPASPDEFTINVYSDEMPVELLQAVNPVSGWNYADGVSTISITYTLNDRFGNGIRSRGINVTPSEGEPFTEYTNLAGRMTIEIPGRSIAGPVTVMAQSVDNESLQVTQVVEFVPSDPVDMVLSASPLIMPSGEVPMSSGGYSSSEIRAKVVDKKGNGVSGQTVTFSLSNLRESPASLADPYLETISQVTDENGYARVIFRPGTFAVEGEPGFTKKATANCSVVAQWTSVSRSQPLEWKNYPILYAETSNVPSQVEQGNYTYVTVKLRGDGFAIVPDPIDVIMCTDRSGSMLYDDPDRMYSVREAGKEFTMALSSTRDQAGLVTFGRSGYISRPGYNSGISTHEIDNSYTYPRSYSSYATIDKSLSNDFTSLRQELDKIVPDHGTPMRYGVYRSIKDIKSNARSNSVKAIILLSDGDYNWYGDPLARGTSRTTWSATDFSDLTTNFYKFSDITTAEQNLTVYAKNNNIKIFSIGYADSISTGGKKTLRVLAEATGGKYYDASASDISDVYTDIAGELQTEAGSDISMVMDFGSLMVDGSMVSNSGDQYLRYEYAEYPPQSSTLITRYFAQNATQTVLGPLDDSPSWQGSHTLSYEVGKMNLGDYWQVQFRLRVLGSGEVSIFGPGSEVEFSVNGEPQTLELPKITVYGNYRMDPKPSCVTPLIKSFSISPTPVDGLLPKGLKKLNVQWVLEYNGTRDPMETIYYGRKKVGAGTSYNTTYVLAYSKMVNASGITNPRSTTIDITGWDPGYTYSLMVSAETQCEDGIQRSPIIAPWIDMKVQAPPAYMRLE